MDEDEDRRVVELFRSVRPSNARTKLTNLIPARRYRTYQAETTGSSSRSNPPSQKERHSTTSSADSNAASIDRTIRTSKPDGTLLALCQFAATRLNAQVVGISLLGRHDQYILAESAQSLELSGTNKDAESEDTDWLGISQVRATVLVTATQLILAQGQLAL
jgi:hypothetical protein